MTGRLAGQGAVCKVMGVRGGQKLSGLASPGLRTLPQREETTVMISVEHLLHNTSKQTNSFALMKSDLAVRALFAPENSFPFPVRAPLPRCLRDAVGPGGFAGRQAGR